MLREICHLVPMIFFFLNDLSEPEGNRLQEKSYLLLFSRYITQILQDRFLSLMVDRGQVWFAPKDASATVSDSVDVCALYHQSP